MITQPLPIVDAPADQMALAERYGYCLDADDQLVPYNDPRSPLSQRQLRRLHALRYEPGRIYPPQQEQRT